MPSRDGAPRELVEAVTRAYQAARRRGDSDYKAWCAARDAVLEHRPDLSDMDASDLSNWIIANLTTEP